MITTMLLFSKNCFILWYLTEEATVDWKSFLGGHFSENLLLMLSNNSTILAKTFWILIQPVTTCPYQKSYFACFHECFNKLWRSMQTGLNKYQERCFLNLLKLVWKQYAKDMLQLILTFCVLIWARFQVSFGSIYRH